MNPDDLIALMAASIYARYPETGALDTRRKQMTRAAQEAAELLKIVYVETSFGS